MSWIITGTQKNKGLLDEFTGAAAAYSLRNLSLLSNPAVVRVRRSDNNAEQDFTATEIIDGTMVAFVGAGNDGLVKTWYDQSGNDNHATQATAGAQPKIVDNGALVTENGKAALRFSGSQWLVKSSLDLTQPISTAIVGKTTSNSGFDVFYDGTSERSQLSSDGNNFQIFSGIVALPFPDNTNQNLFFVLHSGASSYLSLNGNASNTVNIGTNGLDDLNIGAFSGDAFLIGTIQELIIYSSDQSANRVGIEANINAHYSIFP